MIWAAVTPSGRSPLVFVPSGMKLNSERNVSDILESQLLPWADKHFQGLSWSLQQDSAPSDGSKMTQTWIQRKILSFISKELWPARTPTLNHLDFSIFHFGGKGFSLSSLFSWCSEGKTEEGMGRNPSRADQCRLWWFVGRLKAVVRNKGGYIE